MAIRIERVEEGSEATVLGLAGGDELLSVDGNELNDTLDYDFYTDSKSFQTLLRRLSRRALERCLLGTAIFLHLLDGFVSSAVI